MTYPRVIKIVTPAQPGLIKITERLPIDPTGSSDTVKVSTAAPFPNVAYHHTQNSPSAVWNITHNLGFYPNITTMDSSGSVCEGEIVHLTRNTVRITFLAAFSGEAFLS